LFGDNEKRGFSLASWKKLAPPKVNGGWGLKKPFLFSKSLIAKNVWRLIQITSLWVQLIKSKYISLDTMEEWVKKHIKRVQNVSMMWKALKFPFHLVGNWLVWQVGKGD
jgi:hypothetical protein